MVTITLKCRHCESEKIVRDGRTPKGKQRYWCHDCNRSSCENPQSGGYTEEEKETILKAYEERSSMRGLERVFGVWRKTVSVWLKKRAQIAGLEPDLDWATGFKDRRIGTR
ncbi:MAG: hypothetical protein M3X11_03705 [Acidobacteriota bacterium]|nr:hypothetical protein [Acidobacteriota bacterium]